MKNRNLFILVVAILLFITFLASTSALILSGIREDSPEISVVIDDSGSGRWTSFISGLEQAAKDKNIKLNVVSTGKNLSLSQQYKIINEEISDGADGIVLQISGSRGTENLISDISSKAVLLLVDTSADTDVDVEGRSACIQVDNVELGRALANEVRIAFGNDLSGRTVGIVTGNLRQNALSERLQGFTENIQSSGAEIVWSDYDPVSMTDRLVRRQNETRADIIVALDNNGLEAACEYAQKIEDLPTIFGVGTSIKNVSYLDDGLIKSMVVPNEYYMGYQSVSAVAGRLDNRLTPMQDEKIPFRVVNRDNLFDESNQRILFPVVH
ncbi:substrate-binding domain-containing protein [Butyrivibrio sp. XPD2006]|jgi:ribose transport system substrate-binding protein|uniref:substrate-binding domain-containing protein n=1 Tax=Butyrivibrio sp. XPD2006 TaxID=1280668 RepID=UPI0003B3A243|nr:substrate-binding domain-containing protein [Butyrivibrio sp. XPD2006]